MKRIRPSELIPRRPTIKFEIIKKCNASISTVLFFLSFKICPSRHRFDLLKLFYDTNRRISSINSAKRRCTRSRFPPSRRLKKERSWITLVVNAGSGVWKGFNLVFNSRIDRGEGDGDTSIDCIAGPIGWKLFLRSIASICRGNLNGERTGAWRGLSFEESRTSRCKSNSGVKVSNREETCIKPFRVPCYCLLNGAGFYRKMFLTCFLSFEGSSIKRFYRFEKGEEIENGKCIVVGFMVWIYCTYSKLLKTSGYLMLIIFNMMFTRYCVNIAISNMFFTTLHARNIYIFS